MIAVADQSTIGETFFRAAQAYANKSFLAVPANAARSYHPAGIEISYGDAEKVVRALMQTYAAAGYGVGRRIALMLENRPEHMLHKLAMNALGVCCVPLNPDHRPRNWPMCSITPGWAWSWCWLRLKPSCARAWRRPSTARRRWRCLKTCRPGWHPPAGRRHPRHRSRPQPQAFFTHPARPGAPRAACCHTAMSWPRAAWYSSRGGLAAFGEACERIYNPLPLFDVNASIFSFYCIMLKGNCQVQTDRFQPSRWWTEVFESRATVVHYLGVVVPMLLGQAEHPHERGHAVRFAIGAGVEPQRHAAFEQRFGFPLIEIWGMTEMVRAIIDNEEPRQVGTRAFGRVRPGVEVRVVDDQDQDLPDGQAGEMLVRHSAATPRRHFFSGYLDDEAATEAAWRGGWFHTGDIITRDASGLLRFIDRRKNIIRRSGENIAAAEVETLLQAHLLFDHCHANLAYYKAPGWLWLTDSIPTTATKKIQKHQISEPGLDPRSLSGMIDLRALKKRDVRPATVQDSATSSAA